MHLQSWFYFLLIKPIIENVKKKTNKLLFIFDVLVATCVIGS